MPKTITLLNNLYNNEEDLLDFIENFDQVFNDNSNKAYSELDPNKSYKYLITITAIEG
jgi:hypothetical protein